MSETNTTTPEPHAAAAEISPNAPPPVSPSATVTPEPASVTSGGTAAPVSTLEVPPAPLPDLAAAQPIQQEVAGEITEVASTGCYVKTASGGSVLLPYQKGMTDLYTPKVGDFWVVYANGYAFISPRITYLTGHGMEADIGTTTTDDPNAEPNFPHSIRFVTGSPDMLEAWIMNWVTWKIAHPGATTSTTAASTTASVAA